MKSRTFILAVILTMAASWAWASSDFSAVAPSGQTLYYKIIGSTVEIVPPSSDYSGYTKPVGNVVIPSTVEYDGTIFRVTSIGDNAFSCCPGITGVEIPNSVTRIGVKAFYSCFQITEIDIPDSVTSLHRMAFEGCTRLVRVSLGNGLTQIDTSTFEECKRLADITWGNSITKICTDAFFGCERLRTLVIPNTITTIEGFAFYECMRLSTLVLSDSLKVLGSKAFSRCIKLVSVTIPASVDSLGSAPFDRCISLERVVFNASNAKNINYRYDPVPMFNGCSKLTHIVIGNQVESIPSRLFMDCEAITHVAIPNGVEFIGDSAFYGCKSISFAVFGNQVQSIGHSAFYRCDSLLSLTLPASVNSIGDSAFAGCSNISEICSRNLVPPSVGSGAFVGVDKTIPLSVQDNVVTEYAQASGWRDFLNIEALQEASFTVSAYANNDDMGYVAGSGVYNQGCQVTLYAEAYPGYRFVRWQNGMVDNPLVFELEDDFSMMAIFEPVVGIAAAELPKVICSGRDVVIYNAEGENLRIFDIHGRLLVNERVVEGKQYRMPSTGVYLAKVGQHTPIKFAVVH